METQQEMLKKFSEAKMLAVSIQKRHPNDAPWTTLYALLQQYENQVRNHWPLSDEERDGCKLGWFSSKNIEDSIPQLHSVLSDLSYEIRNSVA